MQDRFGNEIDPTVGYARGSVLRSSNDEVLKLRHGRNLVRERLERGGPESLFDLTGLPRAFPIRPEDLAALESQLAFYAHFDGQAEPLAMEFVGADPRRHQALLLNRVTAAVLAIAFTVLKPGDVVLSVSPREGSRSHPSVQRAVERVGAVFHEAVGIAGLRRLIEAHPDATMLVLTPITADKRHLEPDEYRAAVALGRESGLLVFVDDAHMSARCAFFGDPTGFAMADPDLLVFSADKHIVGPRAGVLVGSADLLERIRATALEFGLEAQSGQYVAVIRALEGYDADAVRRAGQLAYELLPQVQARYGPDYAYLAGPGVAISGDDAIAIALEMSGARDARLTGVEAASLASPSPATTRLR